MNAALTQLAQWMSAKEDEHLESKEANNRFDFEQLVQYCCALANEGGGRIILGVTDKTPRRVVGSSAFADLQRTQHGLLERLHLRIDASEVPHSDGRVVVFAVPSRPIGVPLEYKGAYWMRSGESLVPMTPDQLKRIFHEGQPDFSAQVCAGATIADLEPAAIAAFRKRWALKARSEALDSLSDARLLEDAELVLNGAVTYAALVLFGSHRALGKHLAQSEVVFEYRSNEANISHQQRVEYRLGYFLFHDELWKTINLRNEVHSYRDGLFRTEIPAFNEDAVREAILNAISHRDYRLAGSTFIRQYPTKLEIVSPGGFPPEISPETILFKQSPRNRRIAEALARCGLVERAGQGADRMFASALREGKLPPNFARTDAYQVCITLDGQVQDEAFLLFLERLAQESQIVLHVDDLLVLDAVNRERPIPEPANPRLGKLMEVGAIERVGRGRGVRYLLSERFYKTVGKSGTYTRKKGLDRETNKALLLKHLNRNEDGSPLSDLQAVLPGLSSKQIQHLLAEMKRQGLAHVVGLTRRARWYAGPTPMKSEGS